MEGESEHKTRDHKTRDHKDSEHKDSEHKDSEHKDNKHKDNEHKDNEHKPKDDKIDKPTDKIDKSSDNSDYDEEEDEDFDPNVKQKSESEKDSDSEEEVPDYSQVQGSSRQVKTRSRKYEEVEQEQFSNIISEPTRGMNFDDIFNELNTKSREGVSNWKELGEAEDKVDTNKEVVVESDQDKIWINTSYTFAGRVVTESKQVDSNSAEAKAYLNSTSGISQPVKPGETMKRSFVPVLRTIPGEETPTELKIKLKRPSLIDKFLTSLKNQKLSTLEKSRLDWASYVDINNISDELKLHNKDGYLEKQDYLGRLQAKRDENYDKAKEVEKRRQANQAGV